MAKKLFSFLEISEEEEKRGGFIIFNAYYSTVIKGTVLVQKQLHRIKEKQECPETDLYLGRVVLSDSSDNCRLLGE